MRQNARCTMLLCLLLACTALGSGQRTLGLLYSEEDGDRGYTLFAPSFSRDAFLIDACGYLVKKWSFAQPTLDISLLPDGRLFRTSRAAGNFTGGGAGGRLELFSWDGALEWGVLIADSLMHHHHDAQFLPNGNLLLSVWYKYSREEALKKGFRPEKLTNAGIWSDRILEIRPLPSNRYEIVWEWDFWDHTIQDADPLLADYGVVSAFPERLDVNFSEDPGANPAEWLHVNSLDYNARLDQILISSKFHNEVYVIDHSTSTSEARGHTGGRYSKGGDFLYRWGNPRSYGRGTRDQHWLFGQHDAQWIPDTLPGAGHMLLFNNGSNRTGELYSSIDEVILPDNGTGVYPIQQGQRFAPELPLWMYTAEPRSSFYSARISGVQRLPNGNTLVCEGNTGRFFETDPQGRVVWLYRNPVNQQGPSTQGSLPPNRDVFQIHRYPESYPGFTGKLLTAGAPLEINGTPYDCRQLSQLTDAKDRSSVFYPNPATESITMQQTVRWDIIHPTGKVLLSGHSDAGETVMLTTLPVGLYIIRCIQSYQERPTLTTLIKI